MNAQPPAPPARPRPRSIAQVQAALDRAVRHPRVTGVPVRVGADTARRFWSKVRKTGACWDWMGFRTKPHGYGRLVVQQRSIFAHRMAWTLTHGPIPAAMHVLHRCDRPWCVNPDHLFLGKQADNMADMARKGRRRGRCNTTEDVQGERNPRARLTPDQVRLIRHLRASENTSVTALARRFGISDGAIHHIITGKNWRHLLPLHGALYEQ